MYKCMYMYVRVYMHVFCISLEEPKATNSAQHLIAQRIVEAGISRVRKSRIVPLQSMGECVLGSNVYMLKEGG